MQAEKTELQLYDLMIKTAEQQVEISAAALQAQKLGHLSDEQFQALQAINAMYKEHMDKFKKLQVYLEGVREKKKYKGENQ